jgi:hypothetical protein
LLSCEHTFCLSCITKCNNTCPNCRKDFTAPNVSNFIIKQISNQNINCDRGCGWVGKFENIFKHEDECMIKEYYCPNNGCSFKSKKDQLEIHLEKCEFIEIFCEKCQEKVYKAKISVKFINKTRII